MRLPYVFGVVIAMSFAGSASAQATNGSPQPNSEQLVITPATEPRDGSGPSRAEPAPKAEPAPAAPYAATPGTSTYVPVPRTTVPQRAAAPVRAQAPAAAAAPTSVSGPSAEAAARDRIATRRRAAVHRAAAEQSRFADDQYAAGRRAENATGVAVAQAAAASPFDDASTRPAPVAGWAVSAQAPAAAP